MRGFKVFGETTVAIEPSERPFDHATGGEARRSRERLVTISIDQRPDGVRAFVSLSPE
jgi:hypothetical protein